MNARQTILVMLATVVIFAMGVVTGGMLVKKATVAQPPAQFPFFHRFEMTRRAVNVMPELGPEQRIKIQRIINEKQELIADYFQILEPDVQEVFRQMRESIRAEMTPEQNRRFEELARRRFPGPGDRRPSGGFRPGLDQPNPFSSEDPMRRPPRRMGPGPGPGVEDGPRKDVPPASREDGR